MGGPSGVEASVVEAGSGEVSPVVVHEGVQEDGGVGVGVACDGGLGGPVGGVVVVLGVVGGVLGGEPDVDQGLEVVGFGVVADALYGGEGVVVLAYLEDESVDGASFGEDGFELGCVVDVESVAHVVAELGAGALPVDAALYVGDVDWEL